MIKLACCLTRRPEFIRERFQDYRVGAHAPLVGPRPRHHCSEMM